MRRYPQLNYTFKNDASILKKNFSKEKENQLLGHICRDDELENTKVMALDAALTLGSPVR